MDARLPTSEALSLNSVLLAGANGTGLSMISGASSAEPYMPVIYTCGKEGCVMNMGFMLTNSRMACMYTYLS